MKLLVSKKSVVHYLLIYLMILTNGTFFYDEVIDKYQIFFVAFFLGMIVLYFRMRDPWTLIGISVLLLFTVFLRYTVGGIGINIYFTWVINLLSATVAYLYCKEKFVDRFIKIVVFLASISVFYFAICQLNLEIAKHLTLIHFRHTAGLNTTIVDGMFLYSINPWHTDRNTSIFSEPGIYQIVLNSALFLLLFFRERVSFADKTFKKIVLVLLIAIASCQSTTGYIATLVIIVGYIFSGRNVDRSTRKAILGVILLVLMVLLIEYQINGEESILHTAFLSKLFGAGEFDLTASTGKYRMGTIELSLYSLSRHPFGIGYDSFLTLLSTQDGLVAAKLLTSAAACGIPWLLFVVAWLLFPVLRSQSRWIIKVVLIVLYTNTALAQSQEFYPALMILIYVMREFPDMVMGEGMEDNKYEDTMVHK